MITCPGHGTAREVYTWPLHVYAGSQAKKTPVPVGATVIDLAGGLMPVVRALGLTIPGLTTKYVRIEWQDFGVPALDAGQWKAIAKALSREKSVYVACMGGHGRTGTCLAILGHFWGCLPKDMDPVDWLRKVYCSEAVENAKQAAYITAMTGRTVSLTNTWKAPPVVKQTGSQSNQSFTVNGRGEVDRIKSAHGSTYQGAYFAGNANRGIGGDRKEDRSWTLGGGKKPVDKDTTPCGKCGGMDGNHFTFCATV